MLAFLCPNFPRGKMVPALPSMSKQQRLRDQECYLTEFTLHGREYQEWYGWLLQEALSHLLMSSISVTFICVLSHWVFLWLLGLDSGEVVNIQAVTWKVSSLWTCLSSLPKAICASKQNEQVAWRRVNLTWRVGQVIPSALDETHIWPESTTGNLAKNPTAESSPFYKLVDL